MKNYVRPKYIRGVIRSRFTLLLTIYFLVTILIPNGVLANTEDYSIWSKEALILIPLGFYMMLSVALKRSGIMIWVAFPLIIFSAFQIVLLYLFGNSIIATDMFTNLLTTNPGEAGELLANIYPSIVLVIIIYVPLLWLAAREIGLRRHLSHTFRVTMGMLGAILFSIGLLSLYPAYRVSEDKHVVRDEIFPINVFYNVYLCAKEFRKVQNFDKTSEGFSHNASRAAESDEREIYVYVIGEASRAMNWQLYGYQRETNPELLQVEDLVVFKDVLTQSNTTHKSVPLFLSSVSTDRHDDMFRRRGLPALFNEVGFETWFISNQSPQGAMIDNLAHDANHVIYIPQPRYDCQMIDSMEVAISKSKARKMLFILHCYGSHFSFYQRYPREFAYFHPDEDVSINRANVPKIMNSYDNSIAYTDHFLAQTIKLLERTQSCSALLFCSDHGEDIMDDRRGRFLHASPTTTAYQLYVASVAWFSDIYRMDFPKKVAAATENSNVPTNTRMMFHTIADIASITSDYVDKSVSMVNSQCDKSGKRFYLNDHNKAVPYSKTGLKKYDLEVLKRYEIDIN